MWLYWCQDLQVSTSYQMEHRYAHVQLHQADIHLGSMRMSLSGHGSTKIEDGLNKNWTKIHVQSGDFHSHGHLDLLPSATSREKGKHPTAMLSLMYMFKFNLNYINVLRWFACACPAFASLRRNSNIPSDVETQHVFHGDWRLQPVDTDLLAHSAYSALEYWARSNHSPQWGYPPTWLGKVAGVPGFPYPSLPWRAIWVDWTL